MLRDASHSESYIAVDFLYVMLRAADICEPRNLRTELTWLMEPFDLHFDLHLFFRTTNVLNKSKGYIDDVTSSMLHRQSGSTEPEERMAKEAGNNIAGTNQQAGAWDKFYCWFGKGNLREEKVRSVVRSWVRSCDELTLFIIDNIRG